MQGLVLGRDCIDGDSLRSKGLNKTNEVVGIGLIVVRIERTTRPRIVPHPIGQALHLHPLRTSPRRSHYLQVGIEGKYLFQDGDDIVRLVRIESEVLESGCVAKRIFRRREVRATDTDANITDAITLCARKGSRQESLSIGR